VRVHKRKNKKTNLKDRVEIRTTREMLKIKRNDN
jgi:hypothetical protein